MYYIVLVQYKAYFISSYIHLNFLNMPMLIIQNDYIF